MITDLQKNIILKILSEYKPQFVGVFGSYARSEQKDDSDLDLLIDLGKRISLFDLIEIEDELSKQLGVKVDLVTKNSISPLIKKYVYRDLKMIA